MNRAFSAVGLALRKSLGRCPRLVMNAAPLALNRYSFGNAVVLETLFPSPKTRNRVSPQVRTQTEFGKEEKSSSPEARRTPGRCRRTDEKTVPSLCGGSRAPSQI